MIAESEIPRTLDAHRGDVPLTRTARSPLRTSSSHYDSERAHPGRSGQGKPNTTSYSTPFLHSGTAAAWKAALPARHNENRCLRTAEPVFEKAFPGSYGATSTTFRFLSGISRIAIAAAGAFSPLFWRPWDGRQPDVRNPGLSRPGPPKGGITNILRVVYLAVFSVSCPAANIPVTDSPEITTPGLIVVVGAPGLPEYREPFMESANLWIEAGRKAEAHTVSIGLDSISEPTDYQRLKEALEAEPKDSSEDLWLILIGHGTFDGKEAKFNLRGADVTADECAEWLRPFQRNVVVVNCASSSGPFINKLSGPRRVIVTATKSGYEQNLTRFHRYFSEAIHDATADLDKDGQVSVLEAFLIASNRVEEFYSTAGRLATEHALLEDNGDSLGTPADWFRGVRAVKKAQDAASPDGFRAHQLHLLRSPTERKLAPEARARRDELELQIRKLRDKKNSLSEADFFSQLEPIVVEIARIYEESEKKPEL